MPELPEVEVVKQSLKKYILNKKLLRIIVKNKKLRFPVPQNISQRLSCLRAVKVKRVSKYIVIKFANHFFLIIHLGMTGTLHLIRKKNKLMNSNLSFYQSKTLPKKRKTIVLVSRMAWTN